MNKRASPKIHHLSCIQKRYNKKNSVEFLIVTFSSRKKKQYEYPINTRKTIVH